LGIKPTNKTNIKNNPKSKSKLSAGQLLLNVLVELLKGNCLGVVTSNCVNDFPELVLAESVFELVVNVLEFINGELTSSLEVIQTEVSASSFLGEWRSLK